MPISILAGINSFRHDGLTNAQSILKSANSENMQWIDQFAKRITDVPANMLVQRQQIPGLHEKDLKITMQQINVEQFRLASHEYRNEQHQIKRYKWALRQQQNLRIDEQLWRDFTSLAQNKSSIAEQRILTFKDAWARQQEFAHYSAEALIRVIEIIEALKTFVVFAQAELKMALSDDETKQRLGADFINAYAEYLDHLNQKISIILQYIAEVILYRLMVGQRRGDATFDDVIFDCLEQLQHHELIKPNNLPNSPTPSMSSKQLQFFHQLIATQSNQSSNLKMRYGQFLSAVTTKISATHIITYQGKIAFIPHTLQKFVPKKIPIFDALLNLINPNRRFVENFFAQPEVLQLQMQIASVPKIELFTVKLQGISGHIGISAAIQMHKQADIHLKKLSKEINESNFINRKRHKILTIWQQDLWEQQHKKMHELLWSLETLVQKIEGLIQEKEIQNTIPKCDFNFRDVDAIQQLFFDIQQISQSLLDVNYEKDAQWLEQIQKRFTLVFPKLQMFSENIVYDKQIDQTLAALKKGILPSPEKLKILFSHLEWLKRENYQEKWQCFQEQNQLVVEKLLSQMQIDFAQLYQAIKQADSKQHLNVIRQFQEKMYNSAKLIQSIGTEEAAIELQNLFVRQLSRYDKLTLQLKHNVQSSPYHNFLETLGCLFTDRMLPEKLIGYKQLRLENAEQFILETRLRHSQYLQSRNYDRFVHNIHVIDNYIEEYLMKYANQRKSQLSISSVKNFLNLRDKLITQQNTETEFKDLAKLEIVLLNRFKQDVQLKNCIPWLFISAHSHLLLKTKNLSIQQLYPQNQKIFEWLQQLCGEKFAKSQLKKINLPESVFEQVIEIQSRDVTNRKVLLN